MEKFYVILKNNVKFINPYCLILINFKYYNHKKI